MTPRDLWEYKEQQVYEHGKQHRGNFLMGMSEVLMLLMNQLPGYSQKLFTASETVNLTEKIESSHQRYNRQCNDAKVHFSGLLVRHASEVVK